MNYIITMKTIDDYLIEVGKPFSDFYIESRDWFEKERAPRHPGIQGMPGGRVIHTLQVIEKALELNQTQDRKEVIECCLVHDIRGCEKLPLTEQQRLAIEATKGLPYKKWRPTPYFRFVVLILISDMWSAFVNEKNL